MTLRERVASWLVPVKVAPEPEAGHEERLTELEDAYTKLQDEWQLILDRINRWTAREAAKKRHAATQQLDQLAEDTDTQGGGEKLDPGANGEEIALAKYASERERQKAIVAQRFRQRGMQ